MDEPVTSESVKSLPASPGQGFKIGEYTVINTLGHGSMATVYLARDTGGHEVAIKVFQEGPGVSPTMLERFKREAEASKTLRRHPNIMKVYDTGQEGVYHFIVMEPIRNSRTLEDLMETQPLSVEELLNIGIKIARALHYAHTRNIVHRDVKPSNIMMDEFGEPLLTDFGVAELVDWPSCTISGALTGTPLYMSPEQARGNDVGPTSDIYSLGVVLYEAITGMLPYSTQHSAPVKQVLEAVKTEVPRRMRRYRRNVSLDVEAVILKAIEKQPGRRYQDAESFATDLERARDGRRVSARLATRAERMVDLARRYDQFFVAAAVMLTMAVGAGYYLRKQIYAARYDNVVSTAHLRNLVLRSAAREGGPASMEQPTAWNELRLARRDMNASRWTQARDGFNTAIALARSVGDARTAALGSLDLARCETMLGKGEEALASYHDVIVNPDTPPAVADIAQLEAVQLALINSSQSDAVSFLNLKPLSSDSPMRDALRCLAGEISTQVFLNRLPSMPARLQNDFHFVLAVRYRMDGKLSESTAHLRRVLQHSAPASEWPAPFARALLEQKRN